MTSFNFASDGKAGVLQIELMYVILLILVYLFVDWMLLQTIKYLPDFVKNSKNSI